MTDITLIGVDCAVAATNTGLARAHVSRGDRVVIDALTVGTRARPPAATLLEWIAQRPGPALLAIDAPLGWPQGLADGLAGHRAGRPLETVDAHAAFRRHTDNVIAGRCKKRPLDIGADRIARTAFAALVLIEELRQQAQQDFPLAWSPAMTTSSVIEVYPASTLAGRGVRSSGYKGDKRAARQEILDALSDQLELSPGAQTLAVETDHALDAALCCLAGADFLRGQAFGPDEVTPGLEREGWIWVRSP